MQFHMGFTDTVREYALKVHCGRKIPCHAGESNLRWQCASLMLYQLSYIPTHIPAYIIKETNLNQCFWFD